MIKRKKEEEKEGNKTSGFCFSLRLVFFMLFLGSCCLLCSCSNSEPPVIEKQKITVQKKKPKKKTVAKATGKPAHPALSVDKYSYDATGKPDPFVPLITEIQPKKQGVKVKRKRALTPLQRYDLKELKLVAIISTGKNATALLEDPAKYGYIVRDGMNVGKNDGVIKKITENGLIIEEKVYDSRGKLETRISTLIIQHQK